MRSVHGMMKGFWGGRLVGDGDRICGHSQITDRLGVFQQLRGGGD